MKLFFIIEFQLVHFASSLILGNSFLVSPPLNYGEGERFSKNSLYYGGEGARKSENFLQTWWNIHLNIKLWPFYRLMEGFIPEINSREVSKILPCYMGHWYIILKINTRNRGLKNLKTRFAVNASGGDFVQSLSFL